MRRKTAVIMTLSALLLFSVVYGWQQTTLAENYRQQVDSGYRRALYETLELTESMRVNLSKLQVTASSTNRRKLLAELALYAESAKSDIAALPQNLPFSDGALKFLNQITDFSVSYLDQTTADRATLETLLNTCRSLSEEIRWQIDRLDSGEIIFDSIDEPSMPEDETNSGYGEMKYPALLYDGPFSDGGSNRELNLTGDILDVTQAEEAVRHYVGIQVEEIRFVQESHLGAACYEFDVYTQEGVLSVAITRQGGQVVYMLCDHEPSQRVYSVGECVDFASRFLSQRGYEDMRVNYWQVNGAMITVNFAASQEGVILYPDLIKVDVSMESGSILGVEAGNYLANHTVRLLPEPLLTVEQAQSCMAGDLTPQNARLCLIPLHEEEVFCYEFSATRGEKNYLVYIDAMTGDEREILQIVETEKGQLTV